jgi:drug/metabolite transporter (DMT)-like permease
MTILGHLPTTISEKLIFLITSLFDPYVFICIVLTFISGLSWIAAMTKFELSYAFPFTSLSYIAILVLSSFLFHEQMTLSKISGLIFIIIGIIISSR